MDENIPRFHSLEWWKKLQELTYTDEEYLSRTKGFTSTYLFVVTDDPDGNDIKILFSFEDGKMVHFDYWTAPAPSNFRIGQEHWDESISLSKNQGAYSSFAKVRRGEMTILGTMGAKLMKIEGDLIKGISMMAYNVAWGDLQNKFECTF